MNGKKAKALRLVAAYQNPNSDEEPASYKELKRTVKSRDARFNHVRELLTWHHMTNPRNLQ